MSDIPENASLNQMLQWSIKHSDPEALAAAKSKNKKLEPIPPELLDAMFPDEAKKMKEAVATASDADAELDARELALDDLLFMVENIDAAADLPKINGVEPLLVLMEDPSTPPTLREGAGFVLSTACQHNAYTQAAVLNRRGLSRTAAVTSSALQDGSLGLARKCVAVLSALIEHPRGYATVVGIPRTEEEVEAEGVQVATKGDGTMQGTEGHLLDLIVQLLSVVPDGPRGKSLLHRSIVVAKKVLALAEEHPGGAAEKVFPFFAQADVAPPLLEVVASPDMDWSGSVSLVESIISLLILFKQHSIVPHPALLPAAESVRSGLSSLAQSGSLDPATFSDLYPLLTTLEQPPSA